ncbi:hypothetical protein [Micromonospora rubida]
MRSIGVVAVRRVPVADVGGMVAVWRWPAECVGVVRRGPVEGVVAVRRVPVADVGVVVGRRRSVNGVGAVAVRRGPVVRDGAATDRGRAVSAVTVRPGAGSR